MKKTKTTTIAIISITIMLLILLTNTIVLKLTNKNILESTGKLFRTVLGLSNENKTVEFESKDYGEPGSWKITENVKWIDSNKLEITYNLTSEIETTNKNKDVILILDTSDSMFGDKLQTLKEDSIELLDTLLAETTNKIALIEFNTNSNIIQGLTDDKEALTQKINSLNPDGGTNYNQALQKLDEILSTYEKIDSRDLVVMFLTDGYPVEENPSQKATYQILKSKYDYLEIIGVQYEMGETLKQPIKEITDKQYIAKKINLNNVLLEILIYSKKYDEFKLQKTVSDYFEIIDATTTNGIISIDSSKSKVTCNMDKTYMTGSNETITITAKLKDQYQTKMDEYDVNKLVKVDYKISNLQDEYQSSKTPVIANAYTVKYELNQPSGCDLNSIGTKFHLVYSNVEFQQEELKCEGYLFKGFKIINSNVTKMNDNTFIMPDENVIIRAEWSKLQLSKTMQGTIKEKTTLYQAIADKENMLTKKYAGEHKDSFIQSPTRDIYHFYADNDTTANEILNNNNVIFANQCWQILRTTDTGGVKLIYNGEPDSDGKCGPNRGTHVGYGSIDKENLNYNYFYGTDYNYNPITKEFSLIGDIEQKKWDDTTASSLIGKYTCKSTTNGPCSYIYLVESYVNSIYADIIPINSGAAYSQIGKLEFNYKYELPAYTGYKYDDPPSSSSTKITYNKDYKKTQNMIDMTAAICTNCFYFKSATYDKDINQYKPGTGIQMGVSSNNPSELVGMFTFLSTARPNTYFDYIYYIVDVTENTLHLQKQRMGNLSSLNVIGESIKDNGNGTYTLENTTTFDYETWYSSHSTFTKKYACYDTTCTNPIYLTSTSQNNFSYIDATEKILIAKTRNGTKLEDTLLVSFDELSKNAQNYVLYKYTCGTTEAVCTEENLKIITSYDSNRYSGYKNFYFGSSVKYENGIYTLEDTLEIEDITKISNLSNHHYTCMVYSNTLTPDQIKTPGQKECSEVAYVYYYTSGTVYYIILKNGETSATDALNKMLEQNTTNSTIKTALDAWYEKYLLDYSSYIEDTIFCNDRNITNFENSGWNSNGGSIYTELKFKEYTPTQDLSCVKQTDQFSMNNDKAKLKYPIGLATSSEINILNNKTIAKTGQWYWLASPYIFDNNTAYQRYVNESGIISYRSVNYSNGGGIRPSISLIPDIEYSSGNGSTDSPYIIE